MWGYNILSSAGVSLMLLQFFWVHFCLLCPKWWSDTASSEGLVWLVFASCCSDWLCSRGWLFVVFGVELDCFLSFSESVASCNLEYKNPLVCVLNCTHYVEWHALGILCWLYCDAARWFFQKAVDVIFTIWFSS
jgi:hypothetical protein